MCKSTLSIVAWINAPLNKWLCKCVGSSTIMSCWRVCAWSEMFRKLQMKQKAFKVVIFDKLFNSCQKYQSPRIFFRYYLSSAVCVCVCVFAITATPFNLDLSSFGITLFMWISKNSFLKFLVRVIAFFLYFFKISL